MVEMHLTAFLEVSSGDIKGAFSILHDTYAYNYITCVFYENLIIIQLTNLSIIQHFLF